MLDIQLLFFFGALGAFNAFLLGLYQLFVKRNRSTSDFILGFLLFLLAIRVGVSCVYFFGPVDKNLIRAGQVANVLLGPSLFFLFKNQTKPGFNGKDYLHFSALVFGITVLWILFDFGAWNRPIRYFLHGILTVYLVGISFHWRKTLIKVFVKESPKKEEVRIAIVFLATVFVCLGFAISLFWSYILGPLIFSFILYLSVGFIIKAERTQKKSYAQKKIPDEELEKLTGRLNSLMEEERLYRDPHLKLESLASSLSISKHMLSQLLNDNLKKSFNQFVNEYRVEAACELLTSDNPYSIEAIGYEVGFHSRSSFFSTFKKIKHVTPSRFKQIN